MKQIKRLNALQWLGVLGTGLSIAVFASAPSFPTPDKLLVFATFVCLIFGQAKEMLKRFVPFVGLLLVYESFRGVVPHLNHRVNFTWMPDIDRMLFFGELPTAWLQKYLWHGHVQWYDLFLYFFYTLHFVLPFALAFVVWKMFEKEYWRYATTFLFVSFAGFLTFLAFPAAPPWMASEQGYIQPIERVSSQVWAVAGVHDFPSVYNKISPNPVAAVPSLHAAYSTLFAIFIFKYFRKTKWKYLSLVYPFAIYFGTIYQGEHYLIDELLGGLYAVGAFYAAPYLLRWLKQAVHRKA